MELVSVTKIWDRAPHNAFTGLIRFKDEWFCVFREATDHVSLDGVLRVIVAAGDPTGEDAPWTSAARLAVPGADLRDGKIGLMPDGRLMICSAAAFKEADGKLRHQSMVWLSSDGRHWDEGHDIGDPYSWLWRITWHEGHAYTVGYATGGAQTSTLYHSPDGLAFTPLVKDLRRASEADPARPTEATLLFEGDEAICLHRRDGAAGARSALVGRAHSPFTEWTWKDLGCYFGGPDMIRLADGRIVAAGRLIDQRARTALCWLDPEAGILTEALALPSGGDTSYPGLVWHDDLLWVSYYSSHEEKTSIYLAKVRIPPVLQR